MAFVGVFALAGGGGNPGSKLAAAPYLYEGWGNPPSATTVMSATGIKAFTMAFMGRLQGKFDARITGVNCGR